MPSASTEGAAVRVSWPPRPTQREPFQTTRTYRPRRCRASCNYSQCRPDPHFHTTRESRHLHLAPRRNNCARCHCAPPPSPQHPATRLRSRHISLHSQASSPGPATLHSPQRNAVGRFPGPQQRATIPPRRVPEPLHRAAPGAPTARPTHVLRLIQPSDCDTGLFCLKGGLCRQSGHGRTHGPDREQHRSGRH
jgi:hypothetical protein